MASTSDYPVVIEIICPDEKMASDIGKTLVEKKLAACANVLPRVSSIYTWKGKLETATEVVLLVKTMQSSFEPLKKKVLSIHSYECPCIVSWKIDEGHSDYLDWIQASTR